MPHRSFITDHFMLHNETAKALYHNFAKNQPILDYHCHLSPEAIAHNRAFDNITQLWIDGDHYKYRAMRAHGIDEYYITGGASAYEKFMKWAETVPFTLRNPLYHWTHLELKSYFDVDVLLNPDTAEEVFHHTNNLLRKSEFRVRALLQKMRVQMVGTTDDPTDSLTHHMAMQHEDGDLLMLPTFRPDKALAIDQTAMFTRWVNQLQSVSGISIVRFKDFIEALRQRHHFFHQMGCRVSDHGLDNFYAQAYTEIQIADIFEKGLQGKALSESEIGVYRSAVLFELARMNAEAGWVQQFHVGAARNVNTPMWELLGPDQGFDTIGDTLTAEAMQGFLDRLQQAGCLAKTIVYNLNPKDNEMVACMLANFNQGPEAGKMQYGAAWWFLDQKDGIERHLDVLSNFGLLPHFVGMLTDSRSFMSFSRHDYFRRLLCNKLGAEMERGELPAQKTIIGRLVENICYNNALSYFKFPIHV